MATNQTTETPRPLIPLTDHPANNDRTAMLVTFAADTSAIYKTVNGYVVCPAGEDIQHIMAVEGYFDSEASARDYLAASH
jgi:hypothetical protein